MNASTPIAAITLVPNSGIHFWDLRFDLDTLPRITRWFWEELLGQDRDENGEIPFALRELVTDENGDQFDPVTKRQVDPEEAYSINGSRALETFVEQWVPLPIFRVLLNHAGRLDDVDRGPSNWVRARLTEVLPGPRDDMSRPACLTLAFDTGLLPPDPDYPGLTYALNDRMVEGESEFVFVPDSERNAWFLNEAWIGQWLRWNLDQAQQSAGQRRAARRPGEHLARYLTFLALLDQMDRVPRIRFVDTLSDPAMIRPVEVDLVVDIGNSRTCGILVEEHAGQGQNLSDSMPLELRDLSQPHRIYNRPFESRVEFARVDFGPADISRLSGRPGAFVWPSPVRIGPEAIRLAGARVGNEGATGLSSPKRYLWDERPAAQPWRFNGRSGSAPTDPPLSGPFMRLLTESGGVRSMRRTPPPPAIRPLFSRSSLFTFLVAELVLQALSQANSPTGRQQRRDAEVPRRLRRLVLTMPPGMPLAEQRILRERAGAGVRLAWEWLGWSADRQTTHPLMPEPKVVADLDEATATQIVWLHNEIVERMGGDVQALFDTLGPGKERPLRVASIDVGGGTTDLMVASYTLGAGDAVLPRQEFRESFKTAGDDLLRQILAEIVVPSLAEALRGAGVKEPAALLRPALGGDQGGQSEQERHLRRQFVSQVLEPAGLEVLRAREGAHGRGRGVVLQRGLVDILKGGASKVSPGIERAMAWIEQLAREAGAKAPFLQAAEVVATTAQVDKLVRSTFGSVLANLCEVVWHLQCDVLLLSGRPSRLQPVGDIVTARMPIAPHRIVRMHDYRVGGMYPFRNAANKIDDPKTTAAVGAMLSIMAESRLRNFYLRSRDFTMKSTARYIGRLDQSGQLRNEAVLLRDVDLEVARSGEVTFTTPLAATTLLGFRQLPIERWTAQPLYALEIADTAGAQRLALPLQVTIRRQDEGVAPDEDQDGIVREMFRPARVVDSHGEEPPRGEKTVNMRLQTMEQGEGYWRDTGNLDLKGV